MPPTPTPALARTDTPAHSLVILCGGAGSRLGGLDKPLQILAGRPLIEHVLECVGGGAAQIVISANRHVAQYQRYASIVAGDAQPDSGPLAGLLAASAVCTAPELLCVPGDAPYLPPDLWQRLDAARQSSGSVLASVHDGLGPQPLCLLMPCAYRSRLHTAFAQGQRALRHWLESEGAAVADCADWPSWAWSLNTATEWAHVEHTLAQRGRQTPPR